MPQAKQFDLISPADLTTTGEKIFTAPAATTLAAATEYAVVFTTDGDIGLSVVTVGTEDAGGAPGWSIFDYGFTGRDNAAWHTSGAETTPLQLEVRGTILSSSERGRRSSRGTGGSGGIASDSSGGSGGTTSDSSGGSSSGNRGSSGSGGGGGRGGRSSGDDHGDTAGRATRVRLGSTAPWMASTPGQLSPATDVDYFTFDVPQAGVLVVETTGTTDTVGTVWQAGEEVGTDDQSGEGQNFRLRVPVEAGPVVVAVAGAGRRTGRYTLQTRLLVGVLESPGAASFQSGIGVIAGWVCAAETVEIELNGVGQAAAYGTERGDTAAVCGDTDNGFGLLFNWNLLGDGEHEVVAFVDGIELARATVTVTTLGAEFMREVRGECVVADFPSVGETVTVVWQEAQQNFVLAAGAAPHGVNRAGRPGVGALESPGPNSFQSGLGVLAGWVCAAATVEVELGHLGRQPAAYGTERGDTAGVCGDTDNGFGLLFNWNLLGDGEHEVVVYVDDEELGRATVRVTTLGEEFVPDAEGRCIAADFPLPGQTVTLEWQTAQQNFVITAVE